MKGSAMKLFVAFVLFILFVLFADAFYTVSETNQVIITQFGQPRGGTIDSPGLHIKMPFIQKATSSSKKATSSRGS